MSKSNPLVDVLPAKYRRYVYALATAAAFLYALWLASNGDWRRFVAAILASLVSGTAHANTPKTPKKKG